MRVDPVHQTKMPKLMSRRHVAVTVTFSHCESSSSWQRAPAL